jgi:transposase
VPDRNCVAALIFMARTSTPWVLLPARELGCGSATTCWRRFDEWARIGVFDQLQVVLLDELGAAGRIDLDRVSVDSFSLRAVKRGDLTGANPVDRGKAGSKLHLAGERSGLPVAVVLSAANANDSTMLEAVRDDIPPICMPSGRRRRRPGAVHADKAYDHRRCRAELRRRGIRPRIARRGIESSARLGRYRWTIERTGAWAWWVAAAAHPLRAQLRAVLRAGAAGLLGHLLPGAWTATVLTATAVWSVPSPAGYGCQRVTQTTKRRLRPWYWPVSSQQPPDGSSSPSSMNAPMDGSKPLVAFEMVTAGAEASSRLPVTRNAGVVSVRQS